MTNHPADRCKIPPAFWRAFAKVGLPPAAILRQARLPALLARDPEATVTTAQLFAFWKAVEDLADGEDFVLRFLRAFDATGHQPAFVAACYAADFREAIARIDRFKRLSPAEDFAFDERSGQFSIGKTWHYADEPEPAISIDVSFLFLLEQGRKGTGQALSPLVVEYERDGPRNAALEGHFGCPIKYGASANRMVLRSSDLDRPFPGHNLEFLEMVTPALAEMRRDLDAQPDFADEIRTVLKRGLASGRPDLAAVARDLGMSERTLQRRMSDAGTTFRLLLADARRDLGERLLADPSIGLAEVAFLLGYQDASSFHRAFRDSQGTTPLQWRTEHNAADNTARATLH